MRLSHGNIFTFIMCMNGYIITIQTSTNLEKKSLIVPRDPRPCKERYTSSSHARDQSEILQRCGEKTGCLH